MTRTNGPEIRVFFDSDVLFAGSASPNEYSASLVLSRMAEITLIKAITSQQVIVEVERNLMAKMSGALPAFRLLVNRCLTVVDNPKEEELNRFQGLADEKDLPILVAASQHSCGILTTYDIKHFQPGIPEVSVLKPGDLILKIRYLLNGLSSY
jgi:predicted nucleic acid-binding protein